VNTVLTIGTFDMLHVGHLELFRACRRMAGTEGYVVVAVNSDEFVERFKGRKPIQSQKDRMTMLSAIRGIDLVTRNTGDEFAGQVIAKYPRCIVAVGDDWQGKDYLGQLHITQDFLDQRGIRIEYVPRTTGESTTRIRASIGDVKESERAQAFVQQWKEGLGT
jgi:glycerol-3-phosphate cytidylyltransferase